MLFYRDGEARSPIVGVPFATRTQRLGKSTPAFGIYSPSANDLWDPNVDAMPVIISGVEGAVTLNVDSVDFGALGQAGDTPWDGEALEASNNAIQKMMALTLADIWIRVGDGSAKTVLQASGAEIGKVGLVAGAAEIGKVGLVAGAAEIGKVGLVAGAAEIGKVGLVAGAADIGRVGMQQHVVVDALIPNGQAISDGIDLGVARVVALQMPAGWTAAVLTFEASHDGITWAPFYLDDGTEKSMTVGISRFIECNPAHFLGVRRLKVRSGTAVAPVNQGAARTIKLITQP